jgi:predicted transcriptional regulator
MNNHALLISIRPRFAEMIFAGSKTVELRRVCPKITSGDLALVYVSSPTKELQGAFEIGKVISATPSALWKKIGKKSGITRAEFFAYFHGKTEAHALVIERAWKLPAPICLTSLRQSKGGFRPPQSFHYLKRNESPLLTNFAVEQSN